MYIGTKRQSISKDKGVKIAEALKIFIILVIYIKKKALQNLLSITNIDSNLRKSNKSSS
jgi:hypothetical protein